MEPNKQNHAIAIAGITLGGMLLEANTLAEDTGTLVRLVGHEASHSATEVCLILEERQLTEIVLRNHEQHARCEHFQGILEAALRLADCVLHGAGALRRELSTTLSVIAAGSPAPAQSSASSK